MRTFHTGGVAGEDITHGLPRVVELFEARKPKGEAQISELTGTIEIIEGDKAREIKVTSEDGKEEIAYKVPRRARLRVENGGTVNVGEQITEGSVNPHEILRIQGPQSVQVHLTEEVQQVYHSQGVSIHDKHIEVIVRQMLKRVYVLEPGDADFLPQQLVERKVFEETNRRVVLEEGGEPASARPILMGITKASLATDSWLSAASFQETTRVLTDAAISAKSDPLLGLKENVIIGKLIPAGTGMGRYRTIRVFPTEMPERLWAVGDGAEAEEHPTLEAPVQPFNLPVPPQFQEIGPEEAGVSETGSE
jgi:DNA-directed RNA polymerase subunit beta'